MITEPAEVASEKGEPEQAIIGLIGVDFVDGLNSGEDCAQS